MTKDLKNRINQAINNQDLQKGLDKAVKNFKLHREEALSGICITDVQQKIKALREKNLNQIDVLTEKFITNCTKNGMTVYKTDSHTDACSKILEIIQRHNGNTLVKAKSMVSEEIELNAYLEQNGIKVTETDLGEWLVQLAGERPSHITAPAIHMTKERVAALISEKLGVQLPADATEITKFARKYLREEFIKADIGLTGANILVADTGSAVVVTNEGNGRLVSTLPSVHIILATVDKLVENLVEAAEILHILPKSATGQNTSSYVSFISGPSKTADIEKELVIGVHGPEHVYMVLVDNGRSAILEDKEFKEVLTCIKCGACLGMCPVYQTVGGHVFGRKYIGGVGAILTAFIESLEDSKDLTSLCAGCTLCKQNCPANIDIPSMILKLKERLVSYSQHNTVKSTIVKTLFSHKKVFDTSLNVVSFFNKTILGGKSEFKQLPWVFSGLTSFRNLPGFAGKTLGAAVKTDWVILPYDATKPSVALFSGCLIDYLYPEKGIKAINILQKYGYNVIYPQEQTCCGIPALCSGETKHYYDFMNENIEQFKSANDKNISSVLTLCPSCTTGLKKSDFNNHFKVLDFSEFIYELTRDNPVTAKFYDSLTYHPSCHYAKNRDNLTYTHLLLKDLYTERFKEYYDMYNCCGAAGSYAIEFPEISEQILKRKMDNIEKAGTKNLVLDCPGCLMQIKGHLPRIEKDLNILFITDLLEI